MNKTDRMLAIVLELQRHGTRRAEDLADRFETSVRTIYRDMQALSEAGVPIIGAPGQGYSLVEGYFLPPVSFTAEEAVALLLGTELVGRQFDSEYASNAGTAHAKIAAVLPDGIRRQASHFRSTLRLPPELRRKGESEDTALRLLRQAILENRKVRFGYRKPGEDGSPAGEVRTVSPYGLVLTHGVWILVGHCGLRDDMRHFRVSRMNGLERTEEPFERPADFDLAQYSPSDDRPLLVRIRVSGKIADRIRESGNYFLEDIRVEGDGPERILLFRVRKPEDLLGTVLGWGSDAVVLEPEELRNQIREEIRRMAEYY